MAAPEGPRPRCEERERRPRGSRRLPLGSHRITESARLDEASEIIATSLWSTPNQTAGASGTCGFPLNASRGGDSTTSLGSPFPSNHTFSEEILPNVQLKAPLAQLKTISSYYPGPFAKGQPLPG
ncbi:hypothetical protein DUI87_18881 [Hirundo rustica rustica]|uniref:Uncharacterized protein n=1 Tax=Hirundo rustica rustica TaxID=333673 RepID=A0A3M0JUE5_HIRRU|nr:hypothetical protein DUI87_18881 [Hirundo rustica rustica]